MGIYNAADDSAAQKEDSDAQDADNEAQNKDNEAQNKDNEAQNEDNEAQNKDNEAQNEDNEAQDGKKEEKTKDLSGSEEEKVKKNRSKVLFFILGNEFCERFSFYGMRAILTLFLTFKLNYSENAAATIYHSFLLICYFTPLFGAILADSLLGRFWTIFSISILYAVGNIIVSVSAIPNTLLTMKALAITGLFTIGFGTGGIKPCVAAFGGDQFLERETNERQQFFSLFYFVINAGSLLSTFVTPILRADVECFGEDTCYSLAFFLPAVLFVVSLILFLLGKPLYILKPAEGSVFISVFKCIGHAIYRKATAKGESREHWVEFADDKYEADLISDIKRLLRVLRLYVPLPIFWALFEQQGSRWVLQAAKMDDDLHGYRIKPDHMQLVNPLLILIMIPIFQYLIYPLLSKANVCRKPLQRITVGGLLAALSFLITAFIQLKVESERPDKIPEGYTELLIINNSPCRLELSNPSKYYVGKHGNRIVKGLPMNQDMDWNFAAFECEASETMNKSLKFSSDVQYMMVTLQGDLLQVNIGEDSKVKLKKGEPRIRLFFSTDFEFTENENASFLLKGSDEFRVLPNNIKRPATYGVTDYQQVEPGKYKIHLPIDGSSHEDETIGDVEFRTGGSYIVYFYRNASMNMQNTSVVINVVPNSVHILWQIPQGIIMTAGEVMFSITGLEFSYSQAPSSLKSLVQASWLMTSAVGNLLVVLLASFLEFECPSNEFFMYAGIMTTAMIIFGIMAHYYTYVDGGKSY